MVETRSFALLLGSFLLVSFVISMPHDADALVPEVLPVEAPLGDLVSVHVAPACGKGTKCTSINNPHVNCKTSKGAKLLKAGAPFFCDTDPDCCGDDHYCCAVPWKNGKCAKAHSTTGCVSAAGW